MYVFILSAPTEIELNKYLSKVNVWLKEHSSTELLESVSYLTLKKRNHYKYKIAIVASAVDELQQQIENALKDSSTGGIFLSTSSNHSEASVIAHDYVNDRPLDISNYLRKLSYRPIDFPVAELSGTKHQVINKITNSSSASVTLYKPSWVPIEVTDQQQLSSKLVCFSQNQEMHQQLQFAYADLYATASCALTDFVDIERTTDFIKNILQSHHDHYDLIIDLASDTDLPTADLPKIFLNLCHYWLELTTGKQLKISIFYESLVDGKDLAIKALSGFFKSVYLESPQIKGSIVAVNEVSAEIIQKYLHHKPTNGLIWHAHYDQRQQLFSERCVKIIPAQTHESLVRNKRIYVITGGLGELGRMVAEWLITQYDAHVILLGKKSLQELTTTQQNWLITHFANSDYYSVDIANLQDLTKIFTMIRANHKMIHGVFHLAGKISDKLLYKKTHQEFLNVLQPKIQGVLHLDELTKQDNLDFFMIFSSVAGCVGNIGQTDYAYANAFLNYFATYRNQLLAMQLRFGKTSTIAWPYWQGGGMRIADSMINKIQSQVGMHGLPNDVAIAILQQLSSCAEEIVMPFYGDASKWQQRLEQVGLFESLPTAVKTEGYLVDVELLDRLRNILSKGSGIAANEFPLDITLEHLGFDSLIIHNVQQELDLLSSNIPATLLFEYNTLQKLYDYFATQKLSAYAASVKSSTKDEIKSEADELRNQFAIVGIACKIPHCDSLSDFWDKILSKHEFITPIPSNRRHSLAFNSLALGDQPGCYFDAVDKFDRKFFGISEHEARLIDPQERLFLQTAWQCLSNANYNQERLNQTILDDSKRAMGVFVGSTSSTYQLLGAEGWAQGNNEMPAGHYWSLANRVSYLLDLQGPSLVIDTACSSSLTALHMACQSLSSQECKIALVGGVNLYLHPSRYYLLNQSGFISPSGHCHVFADTADGLIPSESVVCVLIKPMADALADGDHIHAVICGTAIGHGGRSQGYTAPNLQNQQRVIANAISNANLSFSDIDYIECHGTGTALGDPLEVLAISKVAKSTYGQKTCRLGSIKSVIGHSEAAAGLMGVINVILQMRNQEILPCLDNKNINPKIVLENTSIEIPDQLTEWKRRDVPRVAGVSSFGAGGVNAHVVIKEAPLVTSNNNPVEKAEVITISAHSLAALKKLMTKYIEAFQPADRSYPHNIRQIAYTLQCGRDQYAHRWACITDNLEDLLNNMKAFLQSNDPSTTYQQWHYQDTGKLSSKNPLLLDTTHLAKKLYADEDYHELMKLWLLGGLINWNILRKPENYIELPDYQFDEGSSWITSVDNNDLTQTAISITKKIINNDLGNTAEYILNLLNQFQNHDLATIDKHASMVSLGMNSIDILSFRAKLEEKFSVTIPLSQLAEELSIQQIINQMEAEGLQHA